MTEILRNVWLDDEGQDLAEYAILLGVVLLVTVATVIALGTDVNTIFKSADTQLKAVPAAPAP
jgi:Flp pilus assembly pilin Flp